MMMTTKCESFATFNEWAEELASRFGEFVDDDGSEVDPWSICGEITGMWIEGNKAGCMIESKGYWGDLDIIFNCIP
jgi:hypothetical protein